MHAGKSERSIQTGGWSQREVGLGKMRTGHESVSSTEKMYPPYVRRAASTARMMLHGRQTSTTNGAERQQWSPLAAHPVTYRCWRFARSCLFRPTIHRSTTTADANSTRTISVLTNAPTKRRTMRPSRAMVVGANVGRGMGGRWGKAGSYRRGFDKRSDRSRWDRATQPVATCRSSFPPSPPPRQAAAHDLRLR